MDETEFYRALSDSRKKLEDAKTFMKKLRTHRTTAAVSDMRSAVDHMTKAVVKKGKTAGVLDTAKDYARALKPELIGGGLGALAGGTYGYLASRSKDGKPSALERSAAERLARHDVEAARYKAEGVEPGFGHKLHGVSARAFKDWAKLMKEHPRAAALFYGAGGASAGAGISRGALNFLAENKDIA